MMDNRLIVALDVDNLKEAEGLVNLLKDDCHIFKVGAYLFTAAGHRAVEMVQAKGAEVFLDLKYHDIPETVARSVKAASEMGIFMATVHTMGGSEMMAAAVSRICSRDKRPLLVGVTVLTSLNQELLTSIGISHTLENQVLSLAKLAKRSGLDGVVASPQEIIPLREELGSDFLLVTPGIRPQGRTDDDQKRIDTPGEAIKKGADFIVVGRPIIAASDPLKAAKEILKEMKNGN